MINKKTIDRDITMLLVLSLMTLISWVGFEVYRAYRQPQIPEVENLLGPITPRLETKVLDVLGKRQP